MKPEETSGPFSHWSRVSECLVIPARLAGSFPRALVRISGQICTTGDAKNFLTCHLVSTIHPLLKVLLSASSDCAAISLHK